MPAIATFASSRRVWGTARPAAAILPFVLALLFAGAVQAQTAGASVSVGDPAVHLAIGGDECQVTPEEFARLAPDVDLTAMETQGDLRVLAIFYPCLTVQRLRLRGEVGGYSGHSMWVQLAPSVSGVARQNFIGEMAQTFAIPAEGFPESPFDHASVDTPVFFARDEHGIYGVALVEREDVRLCGMLGLTTIDGRGYGRYEYQPCPPQEEMAAFGQAGWKRVSGLLARTPEQQSAAPAANLPSRLRQSAAGIAARFPPAAWAIAAALLFILLLLVGRGIVRRRSE